MLPRRFRNCGDTAQPRDPIAPKQFQKLTLQTRPRYYTSDLKETVFQFDQRIRSYWDVENKVDDVIDVTQGEDQSRIRTTPLPKIMAIARNLALNLYRDAGFNKMAQAKRKYKYGLERILDIFRMK